MSYLEELLPEFRKGAKIRLSTWDKEKYIFYTGSDVHDNNDKTVKIDGYQLYTYEWELYQEPIDYDYIIDHKCLCWFWDDDDTDGVTAILVSVYKDSSYRYYCQDLAGCGSSRKNCRPVRRDEVTFYEDRNDEN